jgi:hypothetical protein
MASESLARCKIHGAMLPRMSRTPIDDCQILPIFSVKLIPVRAPGRSSWQSSLVGWSSGDGSRYCDIGQALGHYPTREAAEQAAQPIAQERETELVVHLPDGRTSRKSFKKGWLARLFRR